MKKFCFVLLFKKQEISKTEIEVESDLDAILTFKKEVLLYIEKQDFYVMSANFTAFLASDSGVELFSWSRGKFKSFSQNL